MRKPANWAAALLLLAGFVAWPAQRAAAGVNNQIPSCYTGNGIAQAGPSYDKLFVVLIDQTVLLDRNLEDQVLQSISAMVEPGTHVVVGEFSAFSQGRYLNIALSAVAELPIPAARLGSVPIDSLPMFNRCMTDQLGYAKNLAAQTAYQIMQSSTASLDQSDILLSLKNVAVAVKEDPASRKTVLLVTDGLENSTITSFYARGTARDINPGAEIQKVAADGLRADFGGARMFVIGGGMAPPAQSGSHAERDGYRNPQMLMHLEQFWAQYFQVSNADLVAFGEPGLVVPVTF